MGYERYNVIMRDGDDKITRIRDVVPNSFQYTDGDEFTFNSVDANNRLVKTNYVGYYHTMDEVIMTDRIHNSSSLVLSAVNNISAEYIIKRFEFERTVADPLSLPNTREEIYFQPNEFVNQNTINLKFKMLYDNFLTLYNFGFIANNNFGAGYTGFIGLTGVSNTDAVTASPLTPVNGMQELYGLNFVTDTADDGGGNVGLGMNFGVVGDAKPTGYTMAATNGFEVMGMESQAREPLLKQTPEDVFLTFFSPSALNIFTFQNNGEDSTVNFVLSTDRAGGEFSQPYQSITDITSNQTDTLYVADSYHNQIFRLYIDPILNVSRINAANYDLINAGGLKLNTIGNDFLSGGTNIYFDTYDNELYIYNDGGGNVTVTDENLLFKRRYSTTLLSGGNVADFAINEIDGLIYFLLDDMSILTVPKSFTGNTERVYQVNKLRTGEVPRRIVFSQNDSNVYYVATSKNVYKYFLRTGQDGYIGDYDWVNTTNIAFTGTDQVINDMKILPEDETYDSLFIFDKNNTNNGLNRLLRFTDSNTTQTVLNNPKFKIFDFDQIKVDNEYFNNLSFNKSIKKLIYNLDNLSENIQSKFKFRYDTEQIPRFTTCLTLSSPNNYDISYSNFVGVNEVITPQVFNRVLEHVIQYQEMILEDLRSIPENKKFPDTQVLQV